MFHPVFQVSSLCNFSLLEMFKVLRVDNTLGINYMSKFLVKVSIIIYITNILF